jgi:hypothetical protein
MPSTLWPGGWSSNPSFLKPAEETRAEIHAIYDGFIAWKTKKIPMHEHKLAKKIYDMVATEN